MKNWCFLILILFLTGCQFNSTPPETLLSDGPSLRAFPQADGINLVWNSYILPYYTPTDQKNNDPVGYHVLASETGPNELSRIEELEENSYLFSSVGETPFWFAVEAEYGDGSIARSNIVMSSSSLAQVRPVATLEAFEFSANYFELASGFPLFQQMNSQGVLEINSIAPSESASTLTSGRNPAPHPKQDLFIYLSDPGNIASNPSNPNSLLLWNIVDSSVIPIVVGTTFVDKPSISRDGTQAVYLSSSAPGESTSINIIPLGTNSTPIALITSADDRYSGGGIDGPNFPSFFPEKSAIVVDVPSIDSSTIGRNILLKFIDRGVDSLLIQSPWVDTQPAVHPDGQTMVFVSDRAGSPAVWELEFRSGNLKQLSGRTSDAIVSREYPLHWSTDGNTLWYTGLKDGKTSCYQITY